MTKEKKSDENQREKPKRTITFKITATADYNDGEPLKPLKELQDVANELYNDKKGGKKLLEEYFNQFIYEDKSYIDNLKFDNHDPGRNWLLYL